MKRWYAEKEILEYLGVSRTWLNNLRSSGVLIDGIHFSKVYGKILFDREEVDKMVLICFTKEADGKYIPQERETLDKFISKWQESSKTNGARGHSKK